MKKMNDKMLKDESYSANGKIDACCAIEDESVGGCSCEHGSMSEQDMQHEADQHGEHESRSHIYAKRLIVLGLALTIPLVLLELLYDSVAAHYAVLALATLVQIILGRPFYARFFRVIRLRKGFTTDTLVVLSTSVAYGYSIISLATGSDILFFEASASVLTIFTIGEYLEKRVLRTTSESIRKLFDLKPKTATIIRNGDKEELVDAERIIVGDIVVTRPGERIATDGVVIHGESSIDESMITGESIPIDKKIGDEVIGGTINKNGYIKFKATSVGSDTVLAHIVEVVKKARMSKAHVQRLTDKAVHYFIPIVLTIAVSASLFWLLAAQQPIPFAVTVFATILVVSCPCALGIATPMVVSLGIDRSAREGVLIKGGQHLERLASVDIIVFDKTGTLTKGRPEVTDIIANESFDRSQVLQLAYSAEAKSEHPLALAIVNEASRQKVEPLEISQFVALSGHGVMATYLQKRIFVGNPRTNGNNFQQQQIPQSLQSRISELESEGKTVVAVYMDDKLAGIIAIADTLRDNAKHVIDEIKGLEKKVILMTGDNKRTASAVAKRLGIDTVLAEVLPEMKSHEIKKLQEAGRVVAMVGDGINDAPALTQADIGMAVASGTDVAIASGHVILMKTDLQGIVFALKMGKYAMRKIKQNLGMSFAYNAITISIAAGLLYGLTNSIILTPTLAALGWIVSDSAVFGNSLLMRKFQNQ